MKLDSNLSPVVGASLLARQAAMVVAIMIAAASGAFSLEIVSPNEQVSGSIGFDTACLPDVTGDGFPELVVSTWTEDVASFVNAGRVYIFSSRTGALIRQMQSPNPQLDGAFGNSVSAVPDATGDGIADLAVGENIRPNVEPTSGRAYIFNGLTGSLWRTLQSPAPEADGSFGAFVWGVPDASGDGRGDIAVAAHKEDGGATNGGRLYLFSGATGALLRTFESPSPQVDGSLGSAARGLRDITGDSRGDIIVGAAGENGGAAGSGQAYVFNGFTGGLIRTLVSPNAETGGAFGHDVSGVPDLTGDTVDELMVGARFEDAAGVDTGRVYVFNGATGSLIHTLQHPGPASAGARLGWSIDTTPDINGDGLSEILAGAVREDISFISQGRLHVFDGATGAHLRAIDSPNAETGGSFTFSISGVPDVDGDGRGEVLAGALMEDPGSSPMDAGRAYLIPLAPLSGVLSPWMIYE